MHTGLPAVAIDAAASYIGGSVSASAVPKPPPSSFTGCNKDSTQEFVIWKLGEESARLSDLEFDEQAETLAVAWAGAYAAKNLPHVESAGTKASKWVKSVFEKILGLFLDDVAENWSVADHHELFRHRFVAWYGREPAVVVLPPPGAAAGAAGIGGPASECFCDEFKICMHKQGKVFCAPRHCFLAAATRALAAATAAARRAQKMLKDLWTPIPAGTMHHLLALNAAETLRKCLPLTLPPCGSAGSPEWTRALAALGPLMQAMWMLEQLWRSATKNGAAGAVAVASEQLAEALTGATETSLREAVYPSSRPQTVLTTMTAKIALLGTLPHVEELWITYLKNLTVASGAVYSPAWYSANRRQLFCRSA